MNVLFDFIMLSGKIVIWNLIKWGILGVFLGVIAAIVVFFIFDKLDLYKKEFKYFKWLKIVITVLNFVLFIGLFASIGLGEAMIKTAESLSRQSYFLENIYPKIGEMGAEFFIGIYTMTPIFVSGESDYKNIEEKYKSEIKEFKENGKEININELIDFIDKADKKILEKMIFELKKMMNDNFGEKYVENLKLGRTLNLIFDKFLIKVVQYKINNGTIKYDRKIQRIISNIKDEGAKKGSVDYIDYEEMKSFLGKEMLDFVIVYPVKHILRIQQKMMILLIFIIIFAEIAGLKITYVLHKRSMDKK